MTEAKVRYDEYYGQCLGTTRGVDRNALDECVRIHGHAIFVGTVYLPGHTNERHYDGRCLKCGLYVHMHGQRIVNSWT